MYSCRNCHLKQDIEWKRKDYTLQEEEEEEEEDEEEEEEEEEFNSYLQIVKGFWKLKEEALDHILWRTC